MRIRISFTRALLIGLAVTMLPAASFAEEPTHRHGRKFSRPPLPASVLKVAERMAARDDLSRPDRDSGTPFETMVQVFAEDVVIQGSECVGLDCSATPDFGFDTIRLKENNLRIKFVDTSSSASFPGDDWQIRINDSANGGLNLFAIDHVTSGRVPLVILSDARHNAIYARGSNVGFGTSTPVVSLHALAGDTPTLRLDQQGGFGAYVWDVAGNEANFFIRDVTGGSLLPFRIRPGAPTSSIDIAANGNVGIGTDTPVAKLHVSGATPTVRVSNTSSATTTLALDVSGNLTLSGLLFEASSREVKENLNPVDPSEVLDRLSGLDLWHWNYIADDPSVTHMGPTAEDFAAAFGLGLDDAHIAAMDASGVALSAIQALHRQAREKDVRIDALKAELEAERAKLEQLAEQLTEIRALIEIK